MTRILSSLFAVVLLLASDAYAVKDKGPTTRLDVTSQPAGAKVFVDYKEWGVTPLAITTLAPGQHLVRMTLDGYRDHIQTVQLEPGVNHTVSVPLEIENGLLLLTSDPPHCEVSRGGISLGVTPLLVTTLENGTHQLTLSFPGYQTKEISVTLEGRTPVRKMISLMSDSGTLNLRSTPSDAEVLINGIARGRTPCRIDRIPGGTVTLELRANGFQPHTREFSLAAGETQEVDVPLTPLPGTLRVVSIPDNGRVYINDEFKGVTPFDLTNAPPDTYRVRIDKSGYAPLARNITLAKGAALTEEFRLARITGRLELITAPAGSTVLIDGKKVGITITQKAATTAVSDPFALEDILEGEHEVEIFRKGYANQKRKIEIKRGETLSLQFKLVRQFIPNYEVTTTRSYHKGVLEFVNEEGIRLETAPGISQTIPMKDVKKHGPLREEK